MPACRSCGSPHDSSARFCPSCGAPIEAERAETRRTVTVLFCDLSGSTSLGERLDPEATRQIMSRYFSEMRGVLERHGGTVEKFIGDAVMAVFGIPTVHEDDALRAVSAAAEMRAAIETLNEELRREYGTGVAVRIGVNTGEVVAGSPSSGTLVTGDAVNVAARLEQTAPAGEVFIGETTARLVRDAAVVEAVEPLTLRGKAQPVPAFRLVDVRAGAPAFERRRDSPMVGRDREGTLLGQAYERAVHERSCALFTVLGEAGIGKSKLADEFVEAVADEATVLQGRALSYGDGITYWPAAEVVRTAAGIEPGDSGEVARAKLVAALDGEQDADSIAELAGGLVGLWPADTREEGAWAFRRLVEALARRRPVVLVLDDLQWAEPAFLDLIEHVADWSRDVPLLLVCLARHDLLDARPSWGGGKLNATTIRLEPLSQSEAARMIRHQLGRDVEPTVAERIIAAAEGNPLFVEETIAMLLDEGALRNEKGRWVAGEEAEGFSVPATVQALLAARLDRLPDAERRVLEAASVAGREFWQEAVAAMLDVPQPSIAPPLQALVRRELIRPDRDTLRGRHGFRFRHLLIRDAAYTGIAKHSRADLHEQFASWLEGVAGASIEYDEIIGYHAESAVRYLTELARPDARTRSLASRAATRLIAAGRRATARGDQHAAGVLLARGLALMHEHDPGRSEVAVDLASTRFLQGDFDSARVLLDDAARSSGDDRVKYRAEVESARISFIRNELSSSDVRRIAGEAIDVFTGVHDDAGSARAWRLVAEAANADIDTAELRNAIERALEHSRRAGDTGEEVNNLNWLSIGLFHGSIQVDEAIAVWEQAIERSSESRLLQLTSARTLGGLHGLAGRIDRARELLDASEATIRDLGLVMMGLVPNAFFRGRVEMVSGDLSTARRALTEGCDLLRAAGERGYLSTLASLLGEVLCELGEFDAALAYADEGRSATAEDDVLSQMLWRAVRGWALTERGGAEEGEALLEEATKLAASIDPMIDAYEVFYIAACAFSARNPDAAVAAAHKAIPMFESKGMTPRVRRLRALVERLG